MGRSPWIPGTIGTLGGLPVVWGLYHLGEVGYLLGALAFIFIAIVVSELFEQKYEVHDSREIVIDEVSGYVVAMALLPLTWPYLLSAFVIFRLLDGLKPFPIGWLDRRIGGGLGVVTDDIFAGMVTNLVLQVVWFQTSGVGG